MKKLLPLTCLLLAHLSSNLLITNAHAANPPRPQPPRPGNPGGPPPTPIADIDQQLENLIDQLELTAILPENTAATDINSAKAQLGKKLFYTKT